VCTVILERFFYQIFKPMETLGLFSGILKTWFKNAKSRLLGRLFA